MNVELKTLDVGAAVAHKADALILVLPQQAAPTGDTALHRLVAQARKAGDFEGKPGKALATYGAGVAAAQRVVLAGAGDGSAAHVRQAVAAAMAHVRGTAVQRLAVVLVGDASDATVRAALLAVAEGSYAYTATKPSAEARKLQRVTVGVPDARAVRAGFAHGQAALQGIEYAKEWGNRPANHATPSMLADAARQLGKAHGFKVEVLGPAEVAKLGMGSFMAVAQGSAEPLRFIVMRHDGGRKDEAPVVLVGKGITFDTGGISIKPAAEMDEMKFDMCGAASVLGVFRALGEARPPINVVGLIPACENMPSGTAIKPGDVVTSMSGQTIEILNTDAEGRLVLCDALSYAARFKPRAVIDIATLTGACVIALGGVRSGLFSSDASLAQALVAAGEAAQDLCWQMPLDDDYAEGLKTNFADVANVAGRAGGSVTAAKFLQRFVGTMPWAHLDIAGTAWKGGTAKGATGRPVGLLLQYLMDLSAGVPKASGKGIRKAQVGLEA